MILLKPLKKIEEGRGVGKREFTIAFFCRVEGLPPPPPPWLALATTSCIYVLVKKVSLVFRNFRISNVIWCMQCHFVHWFLGWVYYSDVILQHSKELQAKIRKQLQRIELSPSLYDTAWVAMVPKRSSSQAPCYPQCIEWILQNQHDDGSWGINSSSLSVNKDILLSTLACVVALKKWNAGSYHIRRGKN